MAICLLFRLIVDLITLAKRKRNGERVFKECEKKNKKKESRRRWRFVCGSRFYATRLWHCDFTVMREHARANGSIFFPAVIRLSLSFPRSLNPNFFAIFFCHVYNFNTFILYFTILFFYFYGVLYVFII